jgi:hypothetical protein
MNGREWYSSGEFPLSAGAWNASECEGKSPTRTVILEITSVQDVSTDQPFNSFFPFRMPPVGRNDSTLEERMCLAIGDDQEGHVEQFTFVGLIGSGRWRENVCRPDRWQFQGSERSARKSADRRTRVDLGTDRYPGGDQKTMFGEEVFSSRTDAELNVDYGSGSGNTPVHQGHEVMFREK